MPKTKNWTRKVPKRKWAHNKKRVTIEVIMKNKDDWKVTKNGKTLEKFDTETEAVAYARDYVRRH